MTYLTKEQSTYDGEIRELYSFVLTSGNHQRTTHDEDVTYASVLYSKATGFSRGNVQLSPLTKQREMVLTLPVNDPIVAAMIPSPPRVATVSIVRIHSGATSAPADRRQIWFGSLAGLQIDGDYATIRVPGAIDVAFDVDMPLLRASRTCPHQLYGAGCQVDRDYATYATQGHLVAATVLSVNGSSVVISAMPHAAQWSRHGEVRRLIDGERRSILDQTGTTLSIDVPFGTLAVGNELEVWSGCDKLVATCKAKFSNVANFGGHPLIPIRNPWSPTGGGIR